ncbi:MAG: hypothetical protein M0R33_17135 [Methylomonas sp.]|uniref:hypothetical protein n=1 Tax=Methylomonas sp. TaxID=418 RepID=UPI0025D7A572|nr:hypothetical protein [Methylomonas sp.]MCK9608171.1 hypothetical protein [Methylomonas sp.]
MANLPRGIVSMEYIPEHKSIYKLATLANAPPAETVPDGCTKTSISLGAYIAYPSEKFEDIYDFEEKIHSAIWKIALREIVDLSGRKRDDVRIIAPLFDEYQRNNLSEGFLNRQIKKYCTDITIAELSKIMEHSPARNALEIIRQLRQPIVGLTQNTQILICVDFPLDDVATFCVKFSEEVPMTLVSLYYAHAAVYKEIFRLEAEYGEKMHDTLRKRISGRFGTWGYDIGSLIYNGEGCIIRKGDSAEVYLRCDSLADMAVD